MGGLGKKPPVKSRPSTGELWTGYFMGFMQPQRLSVPAPVTNVVESVVICKGELEPVLKLSNPRPSWPSCEWVEVATRHWTVSSFAT